MKVSINLQEFYNMAKSGKLKITNSGNINFDIIERKEKKTDQSTHYLVQNQKKEEAPRTADDLHF